jgi:glyoxylase-like metal-dependent hydrolase (beta-lactamase superfamily II)
VSSTNKPPQTVFETIFAFAPHRETLGGTAYLIVENQGCILIDAPAWTPENQAFIAQFAPIHSWFITHRGGMGHQAAAIQSALQCPIFVQEQEAYLLPGLALTQFRDGLEIQPGVEIIWTPGHSPGSACLYLECYGGVLFTGRHLLPNAQGEPQPLRTAKTFHWPRQLQSIQRLQQRFCESSLQYLCPGANTGLLRGKRVIDQANRRLVALDLAALQQMPAHLDVAL